MYYDQCSESGSVYQVLSQVRVCVSVLSMCIFDDQCSESGSVFFSPISNRCLFVCLEHVYVL